MKCELSTCVKPINKANTIDYNQLIIIEYRMYNYTFDTRYWQVSRICYYPQFNYCIYRIQTVDNHGRNGLILTTIGIADVNNNCMYH